MKLAPTPPHWLLLLVGTCLAVLYPFDEPASALADEPQPRESWQLTLGRRLGTNRFDAFRTSQIALSSDGKLLGHAGDAFSADSPKLHDRRSRITVIDLDGPSKPINLFVDAPAILALELAGSARRAAVAASPDVLCIFDLDRDTPIAEFKLSGEPMHIRLSAGGRYVAVSTIDDDAGVTRIHAFDVDTRRPVGEFSVSNATASRCFDFRGRSDEIVALSGDRELVFYDAAQSKVVRRSEALRDVAVTSYVRTVTSSPSGNYLLASDMRKRVLLCDLSTSDPAEIIRFPVVAWDAAVTDDGAIVAASPLNGSFTHMAAGTRQVDVIREGFRPNGAFDDWNAMAISRGGERAVAVRLASMHFMPRLQIWSIKDGKIVVGGDIGPHIEGAAFTPSQDRVLTWGDEAPGLWNSGSGELLSRATWEYEKDISTWFFSVGGAGADGTAVVNGIGYDTHLWRLAPATDRLEYVRSNGTEPGGDEPSIEDLQIADSADVMVTAHYTPSNEPGRMTVWKPSDLTRLGTFLADEGHVVYSAAVSGDGQVAAAVSVSSEFVVTLQAWTLSPRAPISKSIIAGKYFGNLPRLALSHDGAQFALAGVDGELSIGTLKSPGDAKRVRRDEASFTSVAWITGTACAVGTADGFIRIVDADGESQSRDLKINSAAIKLIDVSPTRKELLVVGDDGVAQIVHIGEAGD